MSDTGAHLFDPARDLMAKHHRREGAVAHEEVGVTEPTVGDPDEDLSSTGRADLDIVDHGDLRASRFADRCSHVGSVPPLRRRHS
jgi:hypothetical protein